MEKPKGNKNILKILTMENQTKNAKPEAALYLIPVTLGGDVAHDQVLPAHNREVILSLRHVIVE